MDLRYHCILCIVDGLLYIVLRIRITMTRAITTTIIIKKSNNTCIYANAYGSYRPLYVHRFKLEWSSGWHVARRRVKLAGDTVDDRDPAWPNTHYVYYKKSCSVGIRCSMTSYAKTMAQELW